MELAEQNLDYMIGLKLTKPIQSGIVSTKMLIINFLSKLRL